MIIYVIISNIILTFGQESVTYLSLNMMDPPEKH